jgi:hypothetical protein
MVRPIKWRLIGPRTLIVIGALISLCISNNVGPCFLPLPVGTDRIAQNLQKNQHSTASRLPSSNESDNFRVPMMAQKQKRVGAQQRPQPLSTATMSGLGLPEDLRSVCESSYAFLPFTSASISRPPGRAPPRLT